MAQSDPTIQAAMQNSRDSVTLQVATLNENLKNAYLGIEFPSWLVSYKAGRAKADTAPKPPLAYEVGTTPDAVALNVTWAYVKNGTAPVCDMPPIPGEALHPSGTSLIGKVISGTGGVWFSAQQGDATPIGDTVAGMSLDGVSGLFTRYGSPFGGWFKKVG